MDKNGSLATAKWEKHNTLINNDFLVTLHESLLNTMAYNTLASLALAYTC